MRLLSSIGRPLDEPQAAAIEIGGEATGAVCERVKELVDAQLASLEPFLADLSSGRLPVY